MNATELLEQYERERTRWSRTAEADVLEAPLAFDALREVLRLAGRMGFESYPCDSQAVADNIQRAIASALAGDPQ